MSTLPTTHVCPKSGDSCRSIPSHLQALSTCFLKIMLIMWRRQPRKKLAPMGGAITHGGAHALWCPELASEVDNSRIPFLKNVFI